MDLQTREDGNHYAVDVDTGIDHRLRQRDRAGATSAA
jgi:hypothetical protein